MDNLDELLMVTTSNKLQMSDDERLRAIDRLYLDMEDKLTFVRDFNNQAGLLIKQRQVEKINIQQQKVLSNLN